MMPKSPPPIGVAIEIAHPEEPLRPHAQGGHAALSLTDFVT